MNDDAEQLARRYRGALARQGGAPDRPAVEDLEALAAGRLDEARALPLLDRVMSDPALAAEFELLRATHAAGKQAAPRPRVPAWLAAAASVTLVVAGALMWRVLRDDPPVVRGSSPVALAAPGDGANVEAPVSLIWRSVTGALRYQVTVTDSAGRGVVATTTGDTTVAIPPEALLPAASYRWWIEVATGGGGTIRSGVRRFRLSAAGAR